ncbi:MAG: helix-turn-helix transcriptional regulator [Lachnospiraceae bacterium]|nr:helix-turn-helix transcriptional regulator [Lachnospiraceae bacterium]
MARSYNKLWHRLIDLNMTKGELRRKSGITTNALAQLWKNESVPIHTLEKVCMALDCGLEDIVEIFPDEELKEVDQGKDDSHD